MVSRRHPLITRRHFAGLVTRLKLKPISTSLFVDTYNMLNKIKNEGVVAVIRAKDHEEALGYINACLNGGVKAIELTYPQKSIFLRAMSGRHMKLIK